MTPAELERRLRLIVITDRELASPKSVVQIVEAALAAGAPTIQLRAKSDTARELFAAGREVLPLVREAGALLLVNDRVDVALALGADGVHVGPRDIRVAPIRQAVAKNFLIGTSTDDPDRARQLEADGADYIGCGTVYATKTKPDAGNTIGLDGLDRVAQAVDVPVIGIGGITVERSAEVATTQASGVAVIGSVMTATDVETAVAGLLAPWSARG